MLHSTASSGFAISVLSQQDCVSALVTAAQQGPDPRTCQDGISHPQVTGCTLVAQAPQASTAAWKLCTAGIIASGVLHLQAEKPESTAWLSNRLHQSLLSAAMAEPELLLVIFEQLQVTLHEACAFSFCTCHAGVWQILYIGWICTLATAVDRNVSHGKIERCYSSLLTSHAAAVLQHSATIWDMSCMLE